MDKTNLILDLVKEGKITNEQAKVLLEKEKEYVYYPISYPQVYPWYPYYQPTITYSSGTFNSSSPNTLTCSCSN